MAHRLTVQVGAKPMGDCVALVLLTLAGKGLQSTAALRAIPGGELLLGATDKPRNGTARVHILPANGTPARFLLITALDDPAHQSLEERVRAAGGRIADALTENKISRAEIVMDGQSSAEVCAPIIEGLFLGLYRFDKYRSEKDGGEIEVSLRVPAAAVEACRRAAARAACIGEAVSTARDWVNEPPSSLHPGAFAKEIKTWAKRTGLAFSMLGKKELRKRGCGGILAVGGGSSHAPCLVRLDYNLQNGAEPDIVFVGKAVTFDTGGHCLKQAGSMWQMKGDMAGGAAVTAALGAIASLRLPISAAAFVPIVENAIGRDAMLPGDVIKSASGKTVHVDNTDAEGRLILMDALTLAQELKPRRLVDLATLTGAVVRALGTGISGLFCTEARLEKAILEAGRATGELCWPLPLHEPYREMICHEIADIDNSGKSVNAGAITAALFLKEFIGSGQAWAHLDIAGTFFSEKKSKYYRPGATGVGVRLLVQLAESLGGGKSRRRRA